MLKGLAAYVARAKRDGFIPMMVIHPAEVAVINKGLAQRIEKIARARTIIAVFGAGEGAGTPLCRGRMADRPPYSSRKPLPLVR